MSTQIHFLKNEKAFGLVEVLVAMGLMAIVGWGISTMLSNTGKAQKAIQAKDIQREVMAEITSHLSNKTACLNSFGGSNPASAFTKTTIVDSLNIAKYTVGTNHGSNLVQYTEFKIEDWLAEAGYTTQGRANLTVKLMKLGTIIGVKDIEQKIGLRVKLDASNNISECFSTATNANGFWLPGAANPSDIYYGGGNVGIGTPNPVANLDISGNIEAQGTIKAGAQNPGSGCSSMGAQGFDASTGAPLFCANTGVWTAVGGAGVIVSGSNPGCPSGKVFSQRYWTTPSCANYGNVCGLYQGWAGSPPMCESCQNWERCHMCQSTAWNKAICI